MTDACVITLVGDSGIGKSTLISTYAEQNYFGYYNLTVPHLVEDQVLGTRNGFKIIVRDTAGNDADSLNALTNKFAYPLTDCFLLCYATNNSTSFNNLYSKWFKTIKKYEYMSVIIVGLKSDLVTQKKEVTDAEVKLLLPLVKGYDKVICSSFNQQNLDLVFSKAVASCLESKLILAKNKCYCSIVQP